MELKRYWICLIGMFLLSFNRTKWNWNQFDSACHRLFWILLIVLNGIETLLCLCPSTRRTFSFNRTKWNWNIGGFLLSSRTGAFNRTKWNWNTVGCVNTFASSSTFNRTKWNWNSSVMLQCRGAFFSFNRTKWNWNL